MLSFLRSLVRVPTPSSRTVKLGLDVFEDRLVPATVAFNAGVLYIQADPATDDTITVAAAGANKDGSTGVAVTSSLFGGQTQVFGASGDPVTTIALDMGGGNDSVTVASLTAVTVFVGEGDGTNTIKIGDARSSGVIAGSGQNTVAIGGGTTAIAWPVAGMGDVPAGSTVFIGYAYQFCNGGTSFATNGQVGNAFANSISLNAPAGQTTLVDIFGSGDNKIVGSTGNSVTIITGDGNNQVKTGTGADCVLINGNGDNQVTARGSGFVTINGTGQETVRAGRDSGMTVRLNGAGAGSLAVAPNVEISGTALTNSGTTGGGVKVRLT